MSKQRAIVVASALAMVAIIAITWRPDLTAPPASWNRFALDWIRNVLPVLYWSGAIVLLWTWFVLRWQRRDRETAAAQWNRRREMALGLLFLVLAVGETVLQDWRFIGFAVGITAVILAFWALGMAYLWTYARPVWLCRGGRCETVPEPVEGGVLPMPPESIPWDGVRERRVGPKDRRRGQHVAQ